MIICFIEYNLSFLEMHHNLHNLNTSTLSSMLAGFKLKFSDISRLRLFLKRLNTQGYLQIQQ